MGFGWGQALVFTNELALILGQFGDEIGKILEVLRTGAWLLLWRDQAVQSSVVNDKAIRIDKVRYLSILQYRLPSIFSIQIIFYFLSTINASLLAINTCCNFRNFYRFPYWFKVVSTAEGALYKSHGSGRLLTQSTIVVF